MELLRNARDAGAANVYVASTLRRRRFRALTVIDDGAGIPETHKTLVFEPGVTTRHLAPVLNTENPGKAPHGAGLALYHVKNAAVSAEVLSGSSPTAIKVVFDTHTLPERALQSGSRPSKTNLNATLANFLAADTRPAPPNAYYGPPARILATLLHKHIIQISDGARGLWERAAGLGVEVSFRTAQRVVRGEVPPAASVSSVSGPRATGAAGSGVGVGEGPVLVLGEEERRGIAAILGRAAKNSYLEVAEIELGSRPGEVRIRARVYEPEEEYE